MNAMELYREIEIPEEVISELNRCGAVIPPERVEPYLIGMMDWRTSADSYRALKGLLAADEGGFQMLFYQLECARRVHEIYRERQIPEEVFADTMKCFRRFILESERRTGALCFDRGWWTYRQISARLFRLGALEYELHESGNERTIHMHIPSDASLLSADFAAAGMLMTSTLLAMAYSIAA